MAQKTWAVLTDSACDMPLTLEAESGVDILCFGITVDGKAYTERKDFTFDEYYEILRNCEGIPATAQITALQFLETFTRYADAGCRQLLYVSINGTGSATNESAQMARQQFAEARPQSPMEIFIVDSHTYSMAYGWYVAEAAKKLAAGQAMAEVAAWLEDVFRRVEIILGAFSLRFMKKSGRISAAAAFAGELLGLRPVISLVGGVSAVQKKVRGDKDVLPALWEYAEGHRNSGEYMVGGTSRPVVEELVALCREKWGAGPLCTFQLGAAVSTNTGPDAIAIIYLGEAR